MSYPSNCFGTRTLLFGISNNLFGIPNIYPGKGGEVKGGRLREETKLTGAESEGLAESASVCMS